MIRYIEKEQEIHFDLVAPEGFTYKNKLDGCIHGDKIIFRRLTWILGKKLDNPYQESEKDYELIPLVESED